MLAASCQDELYHYTTIETLALILESKKLRFTRIDQVNDLEEVIITDLPELKKAVFVSCWTKSPLESVPLWALYSSKGKGVRIKLPPNMFKRGSNPYQSLDGSCQIINLMSLENAVQREGNVYQWIPFLFGPAVVEYKKSNAVSILEDNELMVGRIGTVKLDHWTFEQEYRFLIIPDALWNPESKKFELNKEFLKKPIAEKHIDIYLDESKLDIVEVTLGPGTGLAEKFMVEALLRHYTKNGTARDSDYKDRIRLK